MTAGILPTARILRAAPLPKDSRTSATTLLSSLMMYLLAGSWPRSVVCVFNSNACQREEKPGEAASAASITDAGASLAEVFSPLHRERHGKPVCESIRPEPCRSTASREGRRHYAGSRLSKESEIVPEATANIGVVGLAVMGSNLARNLASREGNTVSIFNRSYEKTQTLLDEHPEAEFVPASTYAEFAASLTTPRTAIIMVQAGKGTDAVID